ncbi:coiled-coil domain-containing protein [Pantoea ananatis]|uniref:hypothetical protein n=1 Tax=Pantoea ananas TaxID=553 RepID=UPI001EE51F33|nr:hypothetical protein [Pantoea ananatis]PKC45622.1 hypothetical protein V461_05920 [Pantoea ananatis BRT98]
MMPYRSFIGKSFLCLFTSFYFFQAYSAVDPVMLESQLQASQLVVKRLESKAECYKKNSALLRDKSAEMQERIGILLTKEDANNQIFNEKEDLIRGHLRDIENTNNELKSVYLKLNSIQEDIDRYRILQQACGYMVFGNSVCKAGLELIIRLKEQASLNERATALGGSLKDYEARMNQEAETLNHLQTEAADINRALNEMREQRIATEKDVAGVIKNLSEVIEYRDSVSALSNALAYYSRQVASAKPEDEFDEKLILNDLNTLSEFMRRQESEPAMKGIVLSDGQPVCAD